LETLREQEPWLFEESVREEKTKQLMLLPVCEHEQLLELAEFDIQMALKALC
jgi:hypothetical protein